MGFYADKLPPEPCNECGREKEECVCPEDWDAFEEDWNEDDEDLDEEDELI